MTAIAASTRYSVKRSILTTASLFALGLSTAPAAAQTAPAQAAQAPNVEEIVVTGTRVVRDGYEAPTPVSVVSVDQIKDAAPANISEFVNTLPALVGNNTPQSSRTSMTAGGVGINTPQARNLGTARTLILLDGQRNVGSQQTGQVDVNTFPQQLVSRVEVVTGGASAAYGSDALAGVINYVLDRKFTGVKGEVQGGVTTYGDDRQWNISLSGGIPFADGRGHLLLSGELSRIDGIRGVPRDWGKQGWAIITNPAYGTAAGLSTSVPQRLVVNHAAQTVMTRGGIITNTALKGIAFGPGGVPYNLNFGSVVLAPWMQGGEWAANDVSYDGADLDPTEGRHNAFMRLSYDITDDINLFAQYSYAFGASDSICCNHFAAGDLVIKADNAFIPPSVAAQVTALKLTQFNVGSYFYDLPYKLIQDVRRTVRRVVVGGNGRFDAFDTVWSWDAYFQTGTARIRKSFYDRWKSKYPLAIDAVRAPNGSIVCRSTLTNPTNGCVPWNVFGQGVNSAAAANYIAGWSYALERNKQDVWAASMTGEPFSSWAGPVSLATGIEHRKEAVGGIESAANAINDSFIGNSKPTIGSYTVTEGFVETVIPLAENQSWAKQFEFNGAARFTSYSTSGFVTTWKAGATWSPIDDIRVRLTRSRDIRAPHNVELFASGIFVGNLVNDPFRGGVPTNIQSETSGNPNLKPEKADTTGLGIVLQPQFFPGFTTSADYYNINIKDVIGTVGRQEVPDRCYAGETAFCSSLVFVNGILSVVRTVPTNFIKQVNRGIDFEASYTTPLDAINADWGGTFTIRALATRYLKQLQDTGTGIGIVNTVGGGTLRKWKYTVSATYANDPVRINITGRGANAGVYNVSNIQCTSGCPVSTTANITQNDNYQPGAFYWDASFRYEFLKSHAGTAEAFFNVRNVFNTDPAITAAGPAGTAHSGIACNSAVYDCLGRVFRAGIRFQM